MQEPFSQPLSSRQAEQEETTASYKVTATGIHPAILSVNRQIHSEASRIMYSENCFDFCDFLSRCDCSGNEAVIPFLESLSEDSRRLIKQIEYVCVISGRIPRFLCNTQTAMTERVFKETCDYLGQNLQLKHLVLGFFEFDVFRGIKPVTLRDNLLALHGKTWEQHLVPLVCGLDTCELTELPTDEDGPGIIDTVQEYLESKIPRASRPTFSTREYQRDRIDDV